MPMNKKCSKAFHCNGKPWMTKETVNYTLRLTKFCSISNEFPSGCS